MENPSVTWIECHDRWMIHSPVPLNAGNTKGSKWVSVNGRRRLVLGKVRVFRRDGWWDEIAVGELVETREYPRGGKGYIYTKG